jgi:hypothetical protein
MKTSNRKVQQPTMTTEDPKPKNIAENMKPLTAKEQHALTQMLADCGYEPMEGERFNRVDWEIITGQRVNYVVEEYGRGKSFPLIACQEKHHAHKYAELIDGMWTNLYSHRVISTRSKKGKRLFCELPRMEEDDHEVTGE